MVPSWWLRNPPADQTDGLMAECQEGSHHSGLYSGKKALTIPFTQPAPSLRLLKPGASSATQTICASGHPAVLAHMLSAGNGSCIFMLYCVPPPPPELRLSILRRFFFPPVREIFDIFKNNLTKREQYKNCTKI